MFTVTNFVIESLSNPVYKNEAGTEIDCDIKWQHLDRVYPFRSNDSDPEPHGQQLYADLKAGKYGPIAPFVFDPVKAASDIRIQRDGLISRTDWTQGVDVPQATKDKWAPYRQALRDITNQPTFPNSVTWPTLPV